MESKQESIVAAARDLFERNVPWLKFHQAVYGLGGIIASAYPEREQRRTFFETEHGKRCNAMLQSLRQEQGEETANDDAIQVVTVRMPRHLHEKLKEDSRGRNVSLNRWCLKLLSEPSV